MNSGKRASGGIRLGLWQAAFWAMLLACQTVDAQSGALLLVKPWEADQTLEDQTAGYLESAGHVKESHDRFQLTTIESEGRVRLLPGHEASPRFGYELTFLNTRTNRNFPGQLLDVSAAAGTFLSENNGWVTGLTLGIGYAGDGPFARSSAVYGRADFVIAKKFSEQDALGIGIDYDGHRTLFPDVPLPGFGYSHQVDPTLTLVLGFPVSSIEWKPIEHWRIYADYELYTELNLDVGYEFVRGLTAFAAFESRQDAFHVAQFGDNRRLLYSSRRVEAGIRWKPIDALTVSLAAGYEFSTDFREGFDTRSSRRILYGSDEPFARAAAEVRF